MPAIVAMPTTLLNAALGLAPDRSLPVRGPDRVAAVVPMFDEEQGAARALLSLLAQREGVDEVVISVNGGSDATPRVVAETLRMAGYGLGGSGVWDAAGVPIRRWTRHGDGPPVAVVQHPRPVSKADSVNLIVQHGLVTAERVLVMDGDTVLDDGFVAAMRDGFYRLRAELRDGRTRLVMEEVAVQSGAVTSMRPVGHEPMAHAVSAARSAEYAFSTLVRRGQTARLGRGRTFGASRLYTVVGCGFIARRDVFPIPADTMTEDHDFTLAIQGRAVSSRPIDVSALHARGFRVVVDGVPRPLRDVTDDVEIEWRHGADARFEAGATMATEDPPRLSAYVGQIERWIGGGLENGLKRTVDSVRRRSLTPNVRFAVFTAQLENLTGMVLLLALPAVLGLWWPWGGADAVGRGVAGWLLADMLVTGLLVFAGAFIHERARGRGRRRATARALGRTVHGLLPLLLLRPLNAVAYVTAASRVVPRFAWRPTPRGGVTWQRPRALPRTLRTRTAGVGSIMLTFAFSGFVASAHVASSSRPVDREAWLHLHARPRVELTAHVGLPVGAEPRREPPPPSGSSEMMVLDDRTAPPVGASAYCSADGVARAASVPRRLHDDAQPYQPLTPWGLLTLARLAPLATLLEEAATAYDIDPTLLLQLLINESYLDPLAVGPTDDVGLSQVTSDALSLLRSISTTSTSPFANPWLFAGGFSAFDPDFSICAGAAKLAWSMHLPHGDDPEVAYARYINPLRGVVDGRVSDRHRPLVDAFVAVRPMVEALSAAIGAYRSDPYAVSPAERAVLGVLEGVAAGHLDVEAAYRRTSALVATLRINDRAFYERVVAGLYDEAPEYYDADSVLASLQERR